jgi:hypothetical protein
MRLDGRFRFNGLCSHVLALAVRAPTGNRDSRGCPQPWGRSECDPDCHTGPPVYKVARNVPAAGELATSRIVSGRGDVSLAALVGVNAGVICLKRETASLEVSPGRLGSVRLRLAKHGAEGGRVTPVDWSLWPRCCPATLDCSMSDHFDPNQDRRVSLDRREVERSVLTCAGWCRVIDP